MATKVTQKGYTVAKALEDWQPGGPDTIESFVHLGYYYQDMYLTSTGDLKNEASSSATLDSAIADVQSKIEAINRQIGLDQAISTQDASAQVQASLNDRLTTLEQDYASVSAILANQTGQPTGVVEALSSRISFLEGLILGNTTAPESTTSAAIQIPADVQIDKNVIAFGDLNVMGKTAVNELYTLGRINAGFLTIDGLDNSISTLGSDLVLQNSPLAGNVNIFNGKVVIGSTGDVFIDGTLAAKKIRTNELSVGKVLVATDSAEILGASEQWPVSSESAQASSSSTPGAGYSSLTTHKDATIGSATITAGSASLFVNNNQVTAQSKVFLTATSLTGGQPIIVSQKVPEQGFMVELEQAIENDITFDWWIIN
jgi:hypothetical protein